MINVSTNYRSINNNKLFNASVVNNISQKLKHYPAHNLTNINCLEPINGPSFISFKSSEIQKLKTVLIPDKFDGNIIPHGSIISLLLKSIIGDLNIVEIATQKNDKSVGKYEEWLIVKNTQNEYNDICDTTKLFKELKNLHFAKTVVLSRGIDFSFEDFSKFIGIELNAENIRSKREEILDKLKIYTSNLDENNNKLDSLEEKLTETFSKSINTDKNMLKEDVANYFKLRDYLFSNPEYVELNDKVVKGSLYNCIKALEEMSIDKKVFLSAGNSGKDHFNFLTIAKDVESVSSQDFEDAAKNSLVTTEEHCTFELYPSMNEKGELGLVWIDIIGLYN